MTNPLFTAADLATYTFKKAVLIDDEGNAKLYGNMTIYTYPEEEPDVVELKQAERKAMTHVSKELLQQGESFRAYRRVNFKRGFYIANEMGEDKLYPANGLSLFVSGRALRGESNDLPRLLVAAVLQDPGVRGVPSDSSAGLDMAMRFAMAGFGPAGAAMLEHDPDNPPSMLNAGGGDEPA